MGNPLNLSPELVKQIRSALAGSGQMPPGVIAVPEGQAPPPGVAATGLTAPIMPGALHQPGIQHAQRAAARQQQNPLPEGDAGIQILRTLTDCPIPAESKKLQDLMKAIMLSEDIEDTLAEETLLKGLVISIRSNRYCKKQLRKRTVCLFDQDEKLLELHNTIKEQTERAARLKEEMADCTAKAQAALNQRWEHAVKTYGLAPEKFSYQINEEEGIIELLELRCEECRGATSIRKTRQETTKLVFERQKQGGKKDDNGGKRTEDNGTPQGNADPSGKNSNAEQKVQSVADPTDIHDSTGDNGPDNPA